MPDSVFEVGFTADTTGLDDLREGFRRVGMSADEAAERVRRFQQFQERNNQSGRQTQQGLEGVARATDQVAQAATGAGPSFLSLVTAMTAGTAIGNALAQPIQALSGFLMDSISAADRAAVAYAQINAVLDATNHQSGQTLESINALALGIARSTFQTEEGVRSAERVLLTFPNITGPAFEQVIRMSAGMAQVMGGDVVSAAFRLGRALEYPASAYGLLRRAGVVLTPTQRDVIQNLTEIGHLSETQGVILQALSERYQNVATVGLDTVSGASHQVAVEWNRLMEVLGNATRVPELMAHALQGLATALATVATAVERLSSMALPAWLTGALSLAARGATGIPSQAEIDVLRERQRSGAAIPPEPGIGAGIGHGVPAMQTDQRGILERMFAPYVAAGSAITNWYLDTIGRPFANFVNEAIRQQSQAGWGFGAGAFEFGPLQRTAPGNVVPWISEPRSDEAQIQAWIDDAWKEALTALFREVERTGIEIDAHRQSMSGGFSRGPGPLDEDWSFGGGSWPPANMRNWGWGRGTQRNTPLLWGYGTGSMAGGAPGGLTFRGLEDTQVGTAPGVAGHGGGTGVTTRPADVEAANTALRNYLQALGLVETKEGLVSRAAIEWSHFQQVLNEAVGRGAITSKEAADAMDRYAYAHRQALGPMSEYLRRLQEQASDAALPEYYRRLEQAIRGVVDANQGIKDATAIKKAAEAIASLMENQQKQSIGQQLLTERMNTATAAMGRNAQGTAQAAAIHAVFQQLVRTDPALLAAFVAAIEAGSEALKKFLVAHEGLAALFGATVGSSMARSAAGMADVTRQEQAQTEAALALARAHHQGAAAVLDVTARTEAHTRRVQESASAQREEFYYTQNLIRALAQLSAEYADNNINLNNRAEIERAMAAGAGSGVPDWIRQQTAEMQQQLRMMEEYARLAEQHGQGARAADIRRDAEEFRTATSNFIDASAARRFADFNEQIRRTMSDNDALINSLRYGSRAYEDEQRFLQLVNQERETGHVLTTQELQDLRRTATAIGDQEQRIKDLSDAWNDWRDAGRDLGSSISSAFEDIAINGRDAREVMQGLAQDIERILLRVVVEKPFERWIDSITQRMQGLSGAGGKGKGIGGGGKGKAAASIVSGATSGIAGRTGLVVWNGRLVPMAAGSLLDRPSYFPLANGSMALAGEAGPEAVMPLARTPSGNLGIRAIGGQTMMRAPAININVNVDGRFANTSKEAQADMGRTIGRAVQAHLNDWGRQQIRPGGLYNPMGFGISGNA